MWVCFFIFVGFFSAPYQEESDTISKKELRLADNLAKWESKVVVNLSNTVL